MGRRGSGDRRWCRFLKKALRFMVLASFFSFLHSYYSGFPCNLQFSTLIFSLCAHALDRKYMFLICNGILAFLAKTLNSKQIAQLPEELEEGTVLANGASMEYAIGPPDVTVAEEGEETEQQQERDNGDLESIILESEDDDDEDDEQFKENIDVEGTATEEGNDASVSTEELNQKFEEFIRKMKEEIRIEARQ